MYLFFKVGRYEGQVRGPIGIETGRHLIESGQALAAVFDPEKDAFVAPKEEEVQTQVTTAVAQSRPAEIRRRSSK
jgi:hypothetical protein